MTDAMPMRAGARGAESPAPDKGRGRGAAWLALVAALAVSLGLSYAAYRLAGYSWDQFVSYRAAPYADLHVYPSGEPATGTAPGSKAHRVVLVLVDGLREDLSRGMPSLEAIREHGHDLVLTTGQPSLSYPNWTTILTGAPPRVSGVTTNWFKGPVRLETLLGAARRAGLRTAVAGPTDLRQLYGTSGDASLATTETLLPWPKTADYQSGRLIDAAIRQAEKVKPDLLFVLLPDLDNAGHDYGGASLEYLATARRIDDDLGRLVQKLDDDRTVFVITADHGHTDSGGHGGWEPVVTLVPCAISGADMTLTKGSASQVDLAPTVAVLLGTPGPADAYGDAIPSVVPTSDAGALRAERVREALFARAYVAAVEGTVQPSSPLTGTVAPASRLRASIVRAETARLARERRSRLPLGLVLLGAALLLVAAVGLASGRALVAALAGTLAYYVVYDGLFFVVYRHGWSLSALNQEAMLGPFFNARMLDAALAGLTACLVAALSYAALRRDPKGPRAGYLAQWLTLGPATVLTVQATLLGQVAWFLWWYGARITWTLPDMRWAFKYDLDLIQVTALGAAALGGALVTWRGGRRVDRRRTPGRGPQRSGGVSADGDPA